MTPDPDAGAATVIRDATEDDLGAVTALYNASIGSTTVAWTETPEPIEARRAWFDQQQARGFPVLVAHRGGDVVGFTAYGSFRGDGRWPGYRHTVEHTIHVRRDHWGAGVGRRLLVALMARASSAGMHVMVGAVDGDNLDSIRFHERLGFTEVGRMPEIGRLHGRWLDLVLLQRILGDDVG